MHFGFGLDFGGDRGSVLVDRSGDHVGFDRAFVHQLCRGYALGD